MKKPAQKVAYLSRNSVVSEIFHLLPTYCPTARMAEFMFQNVVYRATVYRTGVMTYQFWVFKMRMLFTQKGLDLKEILKKFEGMQEGRKLLNSDFLNNFYTSKIVFIFLIIIIFFKYWIRGHHYILRKDIRVEVVLKSPKTPLRNT